ncbi:MAG TPA: O-antigen ligase family protein [Gemmatimonadales bacterium]|nr:O-antigen ligase family protein [Gemmatimonadales bacterium]
MSGPATTRSGVILTALLVAGALAVVLVVTTSPVFDLDRHAVPKELVLHATALLGLAVMLPGWRKLDAGVVETLLGLYVVWSGVSALFATNHWLAFRSFGISFSGLVVFQMARAARRDGLGWAVVVGLALAATAGALTGLLQAYGLHWELLRGERAPGGTFGNRNFLAHFAVIAMPIAGVVALSARKKAVAAIGLVSLIVLTIAVVLTRSRAAWLAGFVMLGVVAIATWRGVRAGAIARARTGIVVAGLAIGAAAAILVPNSLDWRSGSPYRDSIAGLVNYQEGSGHGRLIQYRNSLKLVLRDPVFGSGPGNWMVKYPLVTTPGDPSFSGADPIPTNPWPSSDWIAVLTERGIIGVALLLMFGLASALVAFRRVRDPEFAPYAVAALGILSATFVTGLFDAVLLLAPPTFFVLAALGALLPDTGVVFARPLPERPKRGISWTAFALSLLLVGSSAMQLIAVIATQEGRTRAVLERAMKWDPGNHRLHLLLAMRAGGCDHAKAAARLLPFHEWPRRLASRC